MHSFLMGKFQGESLLGRTKGRWEDYIRTNLKRTRCEDVEWNDEPLSKDKWTALVEVGWGGGEAFLVPQNVGKFLTRCWLFKQRSAP
jgi:hypothetical protein